MVVAPGCGGGRKCYGWRVTAATIARHAGLALGASLVLACTPKPGVVDLYAASSLRDVLAPLAHAYEDQQRAKTSLNFAGSQTLRLQIEHGAPADAFISANAEHVRALEALGKVSEARPFATGELALIVPKQNPAGIENIDDLVHAKRIVLGTPEVPIGRYTDQLLSRARELQGDAWVDDVGRSVVSRESNARLVRAKVELGEADAAIVYATDVSDDVRAIEIPEALQVRVEYFAARVRNGDAAPQTEGFLAFLESEAARAILEEYGFSVP